MNKVQQSKAELLVHLQDSLGFLESSSSAFDAGFTGEAKRLATTIRVLLHDTEKSKSLMGLLKFKFDAVYLNTTVPYNPQNLMSYHGLVGLRVGGGKTQYWAPLDQGSPERGRRFVTFPNWWNQFVIEDQKKSRFTRRDLILALANKDGGAHVDPELDERYAELTRNGSVGWLLTSNGKTSPLADVEMHSTRQIAHEVLTSIKRYLNKTGL